MKTLGKMVKTQKPTKRKHKGEPAKNLSVPELRERLKAQPDALLGKARFGVCFDGVSHEWAGIGGDLATLATLAWRKFTPAERAAVKTERRAAKRIYSSVAALCSRM